MRKAVSTAREGAERLRPDLYRALGLAAVAAELDLRLDMLEPGAAAAVQKGAATLFLAGFGPSLTRRRSAIRVGAQQVVPVPRIPVESEAAWF